MCKKLADAEAAMDQIGEQSVCGEA